MPVSSNVTGSFGGIKQQIDPKQPEDTDQKGSGTEKDSTPGGGSEVVLKRLNGFGSLGK